MSKNQKNARNDRCDSFVCKCLCDSFYDCPICHPRIVMPLDDKKRNIIDRPSVLCINAETVAHWYAFVGWSAGR